MIKLYPYRREKEIQRIRGELRNLGKHYRRSADEEKAGLSQLRANFRELKEFRKAERIKKARKENTKKRGAFISNPYKFTATVLEGRRSGRLQCKKEEVEEHLKATHGDEERNAPLGPNERIQPMNQPDKPMEIRGPTWKEVTEVVKKARAASAPGPNGIPYKLYKKCPTLLHRLWKMMKLVWKKEGIPPCWQAVDGCFVQKEENSQGLGQFRSISLLNVEGKIFFSVLARRMTTYMTTNEYVDTSTQKGGVPGLSGCVEHTSVINQLIREAKVNRGDLTVVWLDLVNAYGTVLHSIIGKALDQYRIPSKMKGIIRCYVGGILLRFGVKDYMTSWQKLEKGIVTGCTILVVLFVMAMNKIIEAGERETRGPLSRTNIRQPPSRGFTDDLTITATTHVQAMWILTALKDTVSWARMKSVS